MADEIWWNAGQKQGGGIPAQRLRTRVQGHESQLCIWESVESAARADPVTTVRCDWMRMIESGQMCRRGSERNTIAQVTVWRIHGKPSQQCTKQPCPYAMLVSPLHPA